MAGYLVKAGKPRDTAIWTQGSGGRVGIISTSDASLMEVICLLGREGVGVSQAVRVDRDDLRQKTGHMEMLANLRALQADPGIEVIVLISTAPSPAAAERVAIQVWSSDKPTVVCFLGGQQRLAWRAGAIPAARLDEAAMRAAAWVRGWDQALVSSRLEDQDEQLAALAGNLRTWIGPKCRLLLGLFVDGVLCQEAQLMLADVAGSSLEGSVLDLSAEGATSDRMCHLREALNSPEVAVVLMDVTLDQGAYPDPVAALIDTLRGFRGSDLLPPGEDWDELLVITHVCGAGSPRRLANEEARLCDAGVILAPSNATAARLAGMVMARVAGGEPEAGSSRR